MKSTCRVQGQCQVLTLEWLVLISAAKFNQLVYQYPIRIPERFSLVIRSLLTQEGICLTLQPDFKFLEVQSLSFLMNRSKFFLTDDICFLVSEVSEGNPCTISPLFFVQVAYPYVAKRLLTDPDPALRERLLQARSHSKISFVER